MKINYVAESPDPMAVLDIGGQCQVAVVAGRTGTVLKFDGPNGEISFRISDENWRRLDDIVHLARANRSVFDGANYCEDCGKHKDLCDGTRGG